MRVWLLLILAYPLTVHLSIAYGVPVVGAVLFVSLLLLSLVQAVRRGDKRQLLWGGFIALLALVLAVWVGLHNVVFLPPVLINLSLFMLFARSLAPGAMPLITRFAALVRDGNMPAVVLVYTRQVTVAWAVFTLLLTLESILLAIYAPLAWWSLFTNFINYGLVGMFFVCEFALRRWVLGAQEPKGFVTYLRALSAIDFRRAMRP